jgi:hypothetical protein
MKLWNGFGSEHSSNLVMIGHFKDARDADQVKELLEQLVGQVAAEEDTPPPEGRFSDAMRTMLADAKLYSLGPSDLADLGYDARITVEQEKLLITTEEIEVAGFLKILIDRGARVEVYSGHDHPGSGRGR